MGEGAKRGMVYSPATCEVHFGARRRARARRRTIFSPARCSARVGVGEGSPNDNGICQHASSLNNVPWATKEDVDGRDHEYIWMTSRKR